MDPRRRARWLVDLVLLAAVYTATGLAGLWFDRVGGLATLIWPPTGIAIATLTRRGLSRWPGVALGAAATNLLVGASPLAAATIALGNTLEAVVAAAVLRRAGLRPERPRLGDVGRLVLVGALLCPMISATIGSTAVVLGGAVPASGAPLVWRTWWLGDSLGALIIAPLILWWTPRSWPRPTWRALGEGAGLGLALATLLALVFAPWSSPVTRELLKPYLIIPIITWITLRFGLAGTAITSVATAVCAIWGTAAGYGPFAAPHLHEGLIDLQVFLGVGAVTQLALGGVLSERRAGLAQISQLADDNRRLLESESRRRAEAEAEARRDRFLADASAVLAASLDEPSVLARLCQLVVCGPARACLIELHARDGHPRIVHSDYAADAGSAIGEALVVPLRSREADLGHLTLVARDGFVDADRAMIDELAQRCALAIENVRHYQEAHDAIDVRDNFLLAAGHELRTPLTALSLQVESLRELASQGDLPRRVQQRTERLAHNLRRLTRLTDELLDVARLTTKHPALQVEEVDLVEVVHEVVADLCVERDAASEVRVVGVAALPGRWDRGRIVQVVNNLLGNAIKYGGGNPIEIAIEQHGETAHLRVIDHGVGIAPADQRRIFERFERAVSPRQFGGLGLGLWIVRQVVTAHDGAIRVESEVGRGTTFHVELPRHGPRGPASA